MASTYIGGANSASAVLTHRPFLRISRALGPYTIVRRERQSACSVVMLLFPDAVTVSRLLALSGLNRCGAPSLGCSRGMEGSGGNSDGDVCPERRPSASAGRQREEGGRKGRVHAHLYSLRLTDASALLTRTLISVREESIRRDVSSRTNLLVSFFFRLMRSRV